MAQIDTGLGWSAKDDWLKIASSSNLGEIGGSFTNPLPISPVYDLTNAVLVAQISRDIYTYQLYVMATDMATVGAVIDSAGQTTIYGMSLAGTTTVYMHRYENGADIGDYSRTTTLDCGYYGYYGLFSTGTGLYTIPNNWTIDILNCPTYTGEFAMWQATLNQISTTSTVTKDNEGFAVACVAKWKTGSAVIKSPVLISSVSEYTDMTVTPNPGLNLAKLNILYQGMKFYMSFWDNTTSEVTTNNPVWDYTDPDAPAISLNDVFEFLALAENANIIVLSAPDPYQEGEGSEEGGADGEEDEEENVDFTDPPSTAITASGFLTIFCPSLGQLQNLAGFMWTSFDLDNWRRLFANPMDAILGLHIIPVAPYISGTKTVKVAGISTEIMMDYTTIRYIRRSMGTCEIPKKWGAYLDYNPYTKVSIFLPYIGFRDLDTDDIMGRTIELQYIIDVLSGACVAELKCGDTVLYSWEGNCANQVPITGGSWDGLISSALGIAGAIATAALTHGASAPMIAGTIASVGANSMNLKPSVTRSGSIAGSGGFIAAQRPYIIRTIPNLVIPTDQNKFIGYPSFVTTSLGSLTGYNEIASIHLEGIPATGNELSEIETLLKGGVIF